MGYKQQGLQIPAGVKTFVKFKKGDYKKIMTYSTVEDLNEIKTGIIAERLNI